MRNHSEGAPTQHEVWNGPGARGWVESQSLLDRAFEPLVAQLVEFVCAAPARQVLDIGCGTGATTVAVARRLGANGACVGVDLSETMIAAARERAARDGVDVRFIRADAQTHAFESARADMIISQFGVMFFDDPVRAFANLRNAATGEGQLRCIVWRGPAENPFITAAEIAAEPFLPGISKRAPDGPGAFGLAEPSRVERILAAAGWRGIDIAPIDVRCSFPASELDLYVRNLGPVGRALQVADAETRAKVIDAVRPAFDPFIEGDAVRFIAACWVIAARATA